jgi:hypothetical protein
LRASLVERKYQMAHKITVQSESDPSFKVEHIHNVQEMEKDKWEVEVWSMHLSQVVANMRIWGIIPLKIEDK